MNLSLKIKGSTVGAIGYKLKLPYVYNDCIIFFPKPKGKELDHLSMQQEMIWTVYQQQMGMDLCG